MGIRDVRLVWTVFVLALAAAAAPAQTVLLTPPAEPAAAGAPVTVTLYFLNDGDASVRADAPARLVGQVHWAGGSSEVTLTRDADAPARELPPGGFARVPYRLTVPADARGQVTLALPGSPPAVLAVVPPTAEPEPPSSGAATSAGPVGVSEPPAVPAGRHPGISDYVARHFAPYEPMYFLVGNEEPHAKFQISLKYKIFNDDAPLVRAAPPLGGLHFAYSQTSFWDLKSASSPFFDNSYRPELMVSYDDLLRGADAGRLTQLGLQAGLQHESNGQDGADSRSVNYAYVRPSFTFGEAAGGDDERRGGGLFLTVAPRLHAYLGDDEENPDIEKYRGYGDLQVVVGRRGGLQLAAVGRIGSDFDKGSLQLDLSYPLRPLLRDNVDLFLHGQLFTGYGESLLLFDESDTTFRLGVSLFR